MSVSVNLNASSSSNVSRQIQIVCIGCTDTMVHLLVKGGPNQVFYIIPESS